MTFLRQQIAGYSVGWWIVQLVKATVWFSVLGFMARLGWRTAGCVVWGTP